MIQKNAWRQTGGPALVSSVALWACQPPLGLSILAWLAPLGLIYLIDRPESPGRKGYVSIWLAGCLFWLAILQGVRLGFWPLYFGWVALSLYLAVYFPLFVALARQMLVGWRMPLALSIALAWTGLELVRSYMLTGYAASTLAHSQYRHPLILQLADQFGGYGITFIMMATSAGIYRLLQSLILRVRAPLWDLALSSCLLVVLLGYGAYRLAEGDKLAAEAKPLLQAALLQENTPSMFDADPERLEQAWVRYAEMSCQVVDEHKVDVIIWPESTYTAMLPWMEDHTVSDVPQELKELNYDRYAMRDKIRETQQLFDKKTQLIHQRLREAQAEPKSPREGEVIPAAAVGSAGGTIATVPYLLVGNDAMDIHDKKVERFNAALLIDPSGKITNRYEKAHLVMFGEYIPLGPVLKFLGDAFGLSQTNPGKAARAFEVGDVVLAPSICFESMMPQTIAWQMRSLRSAGKSPDLLVNVTNDSWFRGSSMLDHHLACEVLAAVETRRPFIIAANTGISAWIAGSGRIVEQLDRLQPGYIIAQPTRDSRWGLTQFWGDLPAWCAALFCLIVAFRSAKAKVDFRSAKEQSRLSLRESQNQT